ncbi:MULTISPECIES: phosphatase PAP2 family protein [unclassified Candidatus Cardinium]|uniref:phosphatase PAP2 family protein n=1 Tax=unclassified Candidatus Cardinium TaxID=2641185 RepID=UPI001FB23248|nr:MULTISPECIES: phosphatase PAP2 family protein [unclassified Candidatus Cardinium]
MNKLKAFRIIWYQNNFFFYLLAAILTIGSIPFFLFDKLAFFILLKQWHHPVADVIAPYLTWLGDGVTYLLLLTVVALLRASCRKLIIMGGSFLFMSIVVQLFKRLFFRDMLRPIALLPLDDSLHLVDRVSLLRDLSFPSGHAATIFVLISVIQLLSRNKNTIYSIAWLGLALTVAYSRIYLCQHFYIDIYVGAWMGSLSSLIVYLFVVGFNGPNWLDRSIYSFLYTYAKRFSINK